MDPPPFLWLWLLYGCGWRGLWKGPVSHWTDWRVEAGVGAKGYGMPGALITGRPLQLFTHVQHTWPHRQRCSGWPRAVKMASVADTALNHSLTHSLTHLVTHSLIHSLTHSGWPHRSGSAQITLWAHVQPTPPQCDANYDTMFNGLWIPTNNIIVLI